MTKRYIRLPAKMFAAPHLHGLSGAAVLFWLYATAYCVEFQLDGFFPVAALKNIPCTEEVRRELFKAGLILPGIGGYKILSYDSAVQNLKSRATAT